MSGQKNAISQPMRCALMHAEASSLVVHAGFVMRSMWLRNEYGHDEVTPEKILAQIDEVVMRCGSLAAQLRGEVSP